MQEADGSRKDHMRSNLAMDDMQAFLSWGNASCCRTSVGQADNARLASMRQLPTQETANNTVYFTTTLLPALVPVVEARTAFELYHFMPVPDGVTRGQFEKQTCCPHINSSEYRALRKVV